MSPGALPVNRVQNRDLLRASFILRYLAQEYFKEKVRFNCGVKSPPWLIFADEKGRVIAEGFGLDDLDDKIGKSKDAGS